MISIPEIRERIRNFIIEGKYYDGNPVSASQIHKGIGGTKEFARQTVNGILKKLVQSPHTGIFARKMPDEKGIKKWYYFTNLDPVMEVSKVNDPEDLSDVHFLCTAITAYAENIVEAYEKDDLKQMKANLEGIKELGAKLYVIIGQLAYQML